MSKGMPPKYDKNAIPVAWHFRKRGRTDWLFCSGEPLGHPDQWEMQPLFSAPALPPEGRDTERMNWLERMVVEVRQPLVHGSHQLFIAAPESVEGMDDEPSDIRKQIDYQRGPQPQRQEDK